MSTAMLPPTTMTPNNNHNKMEADATGGGNGNAHGTRGVVDRDAVTFNEPQAATSWRVGDIDWGFVFGAQHYGTLVLTLFPAVALGVVLFGVGEEPEGDELSNTLSDPGFARLKRPGSVPAIAAVLVPVAIFIMVLASVEFYLLKPAHRNITNAAHAALFFVINLFCAFVVHIFAQQISAIVVAEPRPDFKSRCRPSPDGSTECTGDTSDAFSSFFSGHASSAMVTSVYSTVYFIWSIYFRLSEPRKERLASRFLTKMPFRRSSLPGGAAASGGGAGIDRMLHEIGHGAVMYVVVLQIGYAWIVGVSRIIDNRHHVWDVNAGLFVGTVVGVLFGVQALGVYKLMPKYGLSSKTMRMGPAGERV